MNDVLWSSPACTHEGLAITRLQLRIEQTFSQMFESYDDFHRWTVENPGQFWSELWDFCGVIGEKTGQAIVDAANIEHARFFPEARLNYAENCLRPSGPDAAIYFQCEGGERHSLSWDDLLDEVSIAQQVLCAQGVMAGDRVAAVMPNIPGAVIYMLATASLGAIWSSCSPDFGAGAVIDRFQQIEPKVLLWADGYFYKDKWHGSAEKITEVLPELNSVRASIRLRFPQGEDSALPAGHLDETALRQEFSATAPEFVRVGFNDPLFILFSSGTSGQPKCIVHSVGGTLLQHLKEHQLHSDLRTGDRLFYFSTCSWMMWNWLTSGLASGAAIVLFDGSPFYPDDRVLWRMAEDLEITQFGISAKYLDSLRKSNVRIRGQFDLTMLRAVFSTGSPLSEANFRYVYNGLHDNVLLASISGGTDIISCFLLGCPTLPVRAGELQCAGLGMDVRIYDDGGKEVSAGSGDLVCVTPFPSRPVGFWGDNEGARYHSAYFSTFENAWCQHDRVERTKTGGFVVLGRSDSTLNPGGVRIGTAEIYRALSGIEEVKDAVVVGRDIDGDVEVTLFVVLSGDVPMDDGLTRTIKTEIRNRCTPRHVPAAVHAVTDIPRTRNGKNSESAVRETVNGRQPTNRQQLENPECLTEFTL